MSGGWNGDLHQVWTASVAVTAAAFAVREDLIAAPTRGRGPRPPEAARWPRKVAIHLAVIVSDCDYLELARLLGMHKDTISSHCAELRQRCADDPSVEALSEAMAVLCLRRLGEQFAAARLKWSADRQKLRVVRTGRAA